MTIKEVSEKTNLTVKSIRYYEEKGLIKVNRTDNDYRVYQEEDIKRLKLIKILRYLDFSIDETLKNNISKVNLLDMMTFDRVDFEKNINLIYKKKLKLKPNGNKNL